MKSVITIYIETDILEKCRILNINRSYICNEALRLAVLPGKKEGQTTEDAFRNYLHNKLEKEADIQSLKKLRKDVEQYPRNERIALIYQKALRDFGQKFQLCFADAVAISQRKEVSPTPLPEKVCK